MAEITRRTLIRDLAAIAASGGLLALWISSKDPEAIVISTTEPKPLRENGPLAHYFGLTPDREHFNLGLANQTPQVFPRTGEITLDGKKYRVMRALSSEVYLGRVAE